MWTPPRVCWAETWLPSSATWCGKAEPVKHQKEKRWQKGKKRNEEPTEREKRMKKKGRDGKNRFIIWLQQWLGDPTGGIRFGGCELTIRCSMIGPWPLHRQVQSSNYLALIESDRLAIFSCFSLLRSVRAPEGRPRSTFCRHPHSATNELNETKRVLKVK